MERSRRLVRMNYSRSAWELATVTTEVSCGRWIACSCSLSLERVLRCRLAAPGRRASRRRWRGGVQQPSQCSRTRPYTAATAWCPPVGRSTSSSPASSWTRVGRSIVGHRGRCNPILDARGGTRTQSVGPRRRYDRRGPWRLPHRTRSLRPLRPSLTTAARASSTSAGDRSRQGSSRRAWRSTSRSRLARSKVEAEAAAGASTA